MAAEGNVLAVYHTYCGGFGDVTKYLTARGARELEQETSGAPPVSVLFALPPAPSPKLVEDLRLIFMQLAAANPKYLQLRTPWKSNEPSGVASGFRDAKTVGLFFPASPDDLPAIKEWLAKHGIEKPSIRLCEYGDEKRFAAIASAKCSACHGALEYLDPRVHGIDTEHLSCAACGGMFELQPVLDAWTPPEE